MSVPPPAVFLLQLSTRCPRPPTRCSWDGSGYKYQVGAVCVPEPPFPFIRCDVVQVTRGKAPSSAWRIADTQYSCPAQLPSPVALRCISTPQWHVTGQKHLFPQGRQTLGNGRVGSPCFRTSGVSLNHLLGLISTFQWEGKTTDIFPPNHIAICRNKDKTRWNVNLTRSRTFKNSNH